MTESTEIQNSDPMAVLEQSIDHETLAVFRRAAFAISLTGKSAS